MTSDSQSDKTSATDGHGDKNTTKNELQHNALGLLTTAAMTAAYMGPALSMYALFGEMTGRVGKGVGFVMLVTLGITLLSAISFGMLAKEMPSAGAVYSWSRAALGKPVGAWMGLNTALYFGISLIVPPIIFGQFFNTFLQQIGFSISSQPFLGVEGDKWTWLLGALLMMTLAAYVAYRGIVVSSHMALTLLLIELAVVVALSITLLISAFRQGTASFAPVTLAACDNGWKGVILTLPFAMMCMVCDAAVPAAEETRNAKWTIPIAVVLTCFIVGAWYVFGFSTFAMAQLPADVPATSTESAVAPMAARVWGNWSILVSITAMTAALGAQIPILTAASRILFAMSRDECMPAAFSRLQPKFHAPWNALNLLCATTAIGAVPAVFIFGSNDTVGWWSYVLGWYIAVVYFAANLVNVVYYWRFARDRFHPVLNAIIPGIAMIVQLGFVWVYLVQELNASGGPQGRSAQAAIVVVTVVSILYTWLVFGLRKRADRRSVES